MNIFSSNPIKKNIMGYLTIIALILALLTPMFLKVNNSQKVLKIDEDSPALMVDETVELTEKADAQLFGKWVKPRGEKNKGTRSARGYGWSD